MLGFRLLWALSQRFGGIIISKKEAVMGSQVDDGNTEGRYMIETERLYIQSLDVDENLHDFHDMWKDPRLVTTT